MQDKVMRTLWICTLLLPAVAALCGCNKAYARVEIQAAKEPFVSWHDLGETLRTNREALTEVDAFGQTRLHAAARQGRVDAVEVLLARGANINARDRWGWTPLSAAVQADEMETAKLLIAKGGDVDVKNNDGYAAANLAALLGKSEMVRLLLDAGADISSANRWGETVLHSAAKNYHKELFVFLWKKGASPDAQDAKGITPKGIVERRGFEWKKLFQEKTGILPQKWVFQTDEDKVGENEKWYLEEIPGEHWRPISTETFWTHQEYPGMWHGTGWYRIDFTVEETGIDPQRLEAASKVLITFGAIDGHPKVWLNGILVGQHTKTLGGMVSFWCKPWSVDVTEVIKAEGVNKLAVSCTKTVFAAGIHPGEDKKPVRLVLEALTHRIQDTGELGVE